MWNGSIRNSVWTAANPKRSHSTRSEEHTSELQSPCKLVCRLLLEKKKRLAAPPSGCSRSAAAPSALQAPCAPVGLLLVEHTRLIAARYGGGTSTLVLIERRDDGP